MAELISDFAAFLQEIRPSKPQHEEMRRGYCALRNRLQEYEGLKDIYVSDFLQGSYRRSTAVRPVADQRSDVDLVVVTNLDSSRVEPHEALEKFVPFVEEFYRGKWKRQGRSIGIELSYVELDLVVTAAPSQVVEEALQWEAVREIHGLEEVPDWRLNRYWVALENRDQLAASSRLFKAAQEPTWRSEPLLIPDREARCWQRTDPISQIQWTFTKNRETNHHYVNVVKALKWWRRVQHPQPKHPKGYPLEHIIGDTCPDGIETVAEGVARTLEEIRDRFADDVAQQRVPQLPDRGIDHDVLERLSFNNFRSFHEQASSAAALAREAFAEEDRTVSGQRWRDLFGSKFPEPPKRDGGGNQGGSGPVTGGGYTARRNESEVPPGFFG